MYVRTLTCNFLMLLADPQIYLLKILNGKTSRNDLGKHEQFWSMVPKLNFLRTSKLWRTVRNFHLPKPRDLKNKRYNLDSVMLLSLISCICSIKSDFERLLNDRKWMEIWQILSYCLFFLSFWASRRVISLPKIAPWKKDQTNFFETQLS